MRVLHVLDYSPPFGGGIVAHLRALGAALAGRGDRLLAAFPEERAWFAELAELAGTIALPQIRRPLRSGFPSAFSRICREERVDLAHLHFSFALPFALACRPRRPGPPTFYHWHNPPRALQRPHPSPVVGALARFADRRAIDAHIAVSSEIRELLRAARWTAPEKIALLPNAYAPVLPGARAPGAAPLPESRRSGDGGRIGSIANFRPQKDHATLLRAFARVRATHPRARLVLAGDGPTRPSTQRLAAELGLGNAVEFPGFVEDPGAIYEQLDVFVLSSKYEGQGLVLLEAMERGLPVVATDLPPIRETLGPELSRLLIPPSDAEAMARAIERLLDDPALREEAGRAGRERVSRVFDVAAWCRSLLALYDRIAVRG